MPGITWTRCSDMCRVGQRRSQISTRNVPRMMMLEPSMHSQVTMQSSGGGSQQLDTGGGTGTGTQVLVKDRVEEKEEVARKEQLDMESWWRVILHNDEIHTFDYVTKSVTKVVKTLTMKKAYEVTMETHKAGKATVTMAWKQKAEGYCLGLQQCGLTASIAPDANFEGNQGGGE